MKSRLFTFSIPFFLFFITAQAQVVSPELDLPLRFDPVQAAHYKKEREFAPRESRGGGSIQLPFFDDFSRYSLPTNNPDIPQDWQRWSNNDAFINCTFPISPMSIGVATLDGLKSNGLPYIDTLYFPSINDTYLRWGLADSLESLPIDLSDHTPEDSIYLLFHFECGGRGNQPDADGILGAEGDSLVLEFYSPLQTGHWFRAWSVQGGLDTDHFDTVMVAVNDPIFLQDGFRFRFKNYCTLHGALDHWHIDYVVLDDHLNPDHIFYDEVAMEYCNNTLLALNYTSMPWTHYLSNPGLFMADEFTWYERNLAGDENISTKWEVSYDGITQFTGTQSNNTSGNGFSEIAQTVSIEGYEYNAPESDSASFEVCVYVNPTDAQVQNDTMCFTQHFSNYYAYDDGSAERAYGIQSGGGKMAMKFNAAIPDSLLGVYMYFMPIQYVATDQPFILQVWDDLSGQPGDLLTGDLDNFNFSAPHYYESGPNLFIYYPLLTHLYIDQGDFYVGYVQSNDVSLNVGLDKNTIANATKLYYQTQGGPWQQSQVQGSVMIRPVFKSGLPDWVGMEEQEIEVSELYPNPTSGEISFNMKPDYKKYYYQVCDITGRIVMEDSFTNGGIVTFDASSLETATYIVRIVCPEDHSTLVKRFMKN